MQQLMEFLDYDNVSVPNNLAGNTIRLFMVGSENQLFCNSVKGTESSVIVYLQVETAKSNSSETWAHMMLVLSMLPYLEKSPSHEEQEKLMSWYSDVRKGDHIWNFLYSH